MSNLPKLPNQNQQNQNGGGPNKPQTPPRAPIPNWVVLILLFVFGFLFLTRIPAILSDNGNGPIEIPYSFFKSQVEAGNVKSVLMTGSQVEGQFKQAVRWPVPGSAEALQTQSSVSMTFTTTTLPVTDTELVPLLGKN